MVVASLNCSFVHAEVPPPLDPTITPLQTPGVYVDPTATSPEAWDLIEAYILSLYPEADYGEICDYALSMFNALPPVGGGGSSLCLPCLPLFCPCPGLCPCPLPCP